MTMVRDFCLEAQVDDQTALNSVLVEQQLEWENLDLNQCYQLDTKGTNFLANVRQGQIRVGPLAGLEVTVLEHAKYRRIPNSREANPPIVFHPLPSRQGAEGVESSLRANGLWV
jgi:hypothetical protein